MARKPALGRGLAALIGDAAQAIAPETAPRSPLSPQPRPLEGGMGGEMEGATSFLTLPLSRIRVNPNQPRQSFATSEMDELAISIKRSGVVQPILARPSEEGDGFYEIVAGERRFRAAYQAGLSEVPVISRALSDREVLEIALVENLHRAQLTPIEEASAYKRLMEDYDHSAALLGESLGKSRSHIANMVRLLDLPPSVRQMTEEGILSAGHARACLGAPSPEALAREIARRGLNVRQSEALARQRKGGARGRRAAWRDPNMAAFERDLSDSLGLAVSVKYREGKGGELRIRYGALEQLEDLAARLKLPPKKDL